MRTHRLRLDPPRFGPPRSAPLAPLLLAVGFVSHPTPARAATDPPPPSPPAVGFVSPPAATDPPPAVGFVSPPADSIPEATAAPAGSVAAGRLVLVHRVLAQDQGDWQVDYGFKNAGAEAIALLPRDIAARVEGWLSNSRVAAHANPRRAQCQVDGQYAATGYADVINSPDEARRCRERVALWVGTGPDPAARPGTATAAAAAANLGSFGAGTVATRAQPPALGPVRVEAGEVVRVRVRFEHDHAIHGDYDPLLGRRDLELKLGAHTFRDNLPLDREQYRAQPRGGWPEPPADRRDARYAVSGPDSLHLDADLIGGNYYPFPDRKVRYSTRMRLRFWYRIAPGTEGELHAKVRQYRAADSYKSLADGTIDVALTTAGRWVLFEKTFRTEPEATTLGLNFQITAAEVGEAWIDDVSLEPVDAGPGGP